MLLVVEGGPMPEIREPLLSERPERLLRIEDLHKIGVLDWDELGAVTTAAGIIEVREAPTQSNRLLSGLFLASVGLTEAVWFAGLVYLGARFL
jgi:hypothetical protein